MLEAADLYKTVNTCAVVAHPFVSIILSAKADLHGEAGSSEIHELLMPARLSNRMC